MAGAPSGLEGCDPPESTAVGPERSRTYGYPVQVAASAFPGIGYVVTCRDLPALVTTGLTRAEAVERAENSLDVLLTELLGVHLPPPNSSAPRTGELILRASPATDALLVEYFGPPSCCQ